MVTLVKKGIFEILKSLSKNKEVYEGLGKALDLREYSKEKVNDEGPGRMDLEKRKRKLVESRDGRPLGFSCLFGPKW
jgi:hypothetical protein